MKRKLSVIVFLLVSCSGIAKTKVKVTVSNKMLTIINTANNDTIVSPNNIQLWKKFGDAEHHLTSAEPSIFTKTVSNGCNIVFTYTNTTNAPMSLGKIQIGGMRMNNLIKARAFHREGEEVEYNYNNKSLDSTYTAYSAMYPRNLFSPVMTIDNGKYTICISMLYPVIDYKHNSYQYLQRLANKKDWTATFKLNACGKDANGVREDDVTKYSTRGDLKPGETRTYTLCIRIITNSNSCESWQEGLQPYKDYFRNLYGGIHYKADRRPVKSIPTSMREKCGPDNPYGFTNAIIHPLAHLRPDSFGFGPLTHYMIEGCQAQNYKRMILIRPTGSYWHNPTLNFPYKFTSHWMEGDPDQFPHSYGHAMGDAPDSLQLISKAGIEFGLCWGHSGSIMFNWDTNDMEPFNINNQTHLTTAYKEFDLAVKTKAKLISLDQFRVFLPVWDGYEWLQMLRQRSPQMKFLTERWGCDVLQTIAGMYALDQPDNQVLGPHLLADFLLPGTEKMVMLDELDSTKELRSAKMKLLNSWGYSVSQVGSDTLPVNGFIAQQSWYKYNPYPDLGPDRCFNPNGITLNGKCKNSTSYLWSTGAKTPTIIVNSPGTYYVITTSNGCTVSDTVKIFPQQCKQNEYYYYDNDEDGTESNFQNIQGGKQDNILNIYPNPANDFITIINISEASIKSIKLFNVLGAFVAELNNGLQGFETTNASITNFPAGIYYVIAEGENETFSKKLIIAK